MKNLLASPAFQDKLGRCIRCGLCLPACPTYEIFRTEMDGPRGRIALMGAAAEGRIGLDGALREHLDLCLGCRACETACPSGVEYGALLHDTRQAIEAHRRRSPVESFVRWLALRQLLPHRGRLRLLARLLGVARTLGLVRAAAAAAWLPAGLRRLAALLPPAAGKVPNHRRRLPPATPKRGTVAFFRGCAQDAFLPAANAATLRVLQRNGYEVHFPAGQTCCGAAALHLGETELARDLARRNLRAFDPGAYDAVVSNAGGCGAMLKEYPRLLPDSDSAPPFAAKVQDVCELLAGRLAAPTGRLETRVTYADSCHLRHAQGVVSEPRALLRAIPGLELVELARPDACCGSAGVYNLVQPETADRVLAAKIAEIRASGAEVVATTNTGCHLQLLCGLRDAGLGAEVLHVMELLDRSYDAAAD